MKDSNPVTTFLSDYRPPNWTIEQTQLVFELDPNDTVVRSRLQLKRLADGPLQLDGVGLTLESVKVDGTELNEGRYQLGDEQLLIEELPDNCVIEIVNRINPMANTALEGLYCSSNNFCTQCEAEGFRKITYYLDRPDVLSTFTVSIIADQKRYPVLLSNGNQQGVQLLDDGRHQTDWHDPFPKPCYLFALVAGDLARIEDSFVTQSKRSVDLHIYVESHNIDQCQYAMDALKRSMEWDESVYGLEYDLDLYMIVAVDDFNAGAMENKGLNVFNSKYVLADAELATDTDFLGVEAVIAHEYFHNWTGNRITCRDWFQLSLKEGLTVFRDQEFSSDMQSREVKRIEDVRLLRERQFPEDASPMSHPIRPDQYMEINNFYTLTVYEKGAEVIRMIHTVLGPDLYRKGIDLYFSRHDGQAVTCDDFVQCMQDASDIDLSVMKRWYSQSGTPTVRVNDSFDEVNKRYTLTVTQSNLARNGESREALHIPLRVGLLNSAGTELPLGIGRFDGSGSTVLDVIEKQQSFVFEGVNEKPTPSLLRNFSAPVQLYFDYSDADLAFLIANDSDSFNRWEAGQRYATRVIEQLLANDAAEVPAEFVDAFALIITDEKLDAGFRSMILHMPGIDSLANSQSLVDIHALDKALRNINRAIAKRYQDVLAALVRSGIQNNKTASIGDRQLSNTALALLTHLDSALWLPLANEQYQQATNMTNRIAGLSAMCNERSIERDNALGDFYGRYEKHRLVIDKWFSVQARAQHENVIDDVVALSSHSAFDANNPNRFRSLIGAFASGNPVHLHAADGAGYTLVANYILKLDGANPQLAARLVTPFLQWQRFVEPQRGLMHETLERIAAAPKLSPDVYEIVHKGLAR